MIRLAVAEWFDIKLLGPAFETVICEVGTKGNMRRGQALISAGRFCHILRNRGKSKIAISVGGFHDDPRELWDIPEAREFLSIFTAAVEVAGFPREDWNMIPESIGVIAMCTGRGTAIPKPGGFDIHVNLKGTT